MVGRLHNSLIYLPDSAKLPAVARLVVRAFTWGNLLDLIYDRSNIEVCSMEQAFQAAGRVSIYLSSVRAAQKLYTLLDTAR